MWVHGELVLRTCVDRNLEPRRFWDGVVELLRVVDLVSGFLLVDADVVDLLGGVRDDTV